MALSPETLRLRAIASRFAFELIKEGARAVAVTGSVGRGNATPGSDVDFWLIGKTDERQLRSFQGASITVMQECPRTLLNLDRLARVEVDDIWVIYDPEKQFDRVRGIYERERATLKQRSVDSSVVDIFRAAVHSRRPHPLEALEALREMVLLTATLEVYLQQGWRVPKDRHFAEQLSPVRLKRLRRALGWSPDAAAVEGMRAQAKKLHVATKALFRKLGREGEVPAPSAFLAKVAAGHVAEALHQGRKYFEDTVFAAVRPTLSGQVTLSVLVAALPLALRESFHLLNGTSGDGRGDAARVTRVRRDVRDFMAGSAVRPLLSIDGYLAG